MEKSKEITKQLAEQTKITSDLTKVLSHMEARDHPVRPQRQKRTRNRGKGGAGSKFTKQVFRATGSRPARTGPSNTVGVAPLASNVQVSMPRIVSEYRKKGGMGGFGMIDVISGTEFLATISPEAPVPVGNVLHQIKINPESFSGTRIHQFSQLYQRYRFRKLAFYYEAIAPATTSGQFVAYIDLDPNNLLPDVGGVQNLKIAAAYNGMRITQVWQSIRIPFGIVDDYTTLFCEIDNTIDPRLVYQGIFNILAASTLPAEALGNLYIEYECEMIQPRLDLRVANSQIFSYDAQKQGGAGAGWAYPLIPFGNAVEPHAGFPEVNLTFVYSTDGGVSTFTGQDIPLGLYLSYVNLTLGVVIPPTEVDGEFSIDGYDFTGSTGWAFLEDAAGATPGFGILTSVVQAPVGDSYSATLRTGRMGYIEVTSATPVFKIRYESGSAPVSTVFSEDGEAPAIFALVSIGTLTPPKTYRKPKLSKTLSLKTPTVSRTLLKGKDLETPKVGTENPNIRACQHGVSHIEKGGCHICLRNLNRK